MIRKNIVKPLVPQALQDLISLVEDPPVIEVIQSWTIEQRMEVEHWAVREHLHASDNAIPRRPRPQFLPRRAV